MKIKYLLIFLVLATSLVQSASGQQNTIGEPNCGQWVSRKRESDKAWLLGYLSGASSWQVATKSNILKQVGSAEQIFLWMDNYCKANPLSFLSEGGDKLIFELVAMTPAK
jgi:hypothetical protein